MTKLEELKAAWDAAEAAAVAAHDASEAARGARDEAFYDARAAWGAYQTELYKSEENSND
jgi:hypothetical protein